MSCCDPSNQNYKHEIKRTAAYANKSCECAAASAASEAASAASAAASAASAASAAADAADAQEALSEFQERYMGAYPAPPVATQVGALYWNSSSNALFVWNGTSWVAAPSGFNEFTTFLATGTTTARNLVTRTSDDANVKDFGALSDYYLPDGSLNPSPTDNLAAFTAALTSGAEVVYIPQGTYYLSNGINVPSGVTLQGAGMLPGQATATPKLTLSGVTGSTLIFNTPVMTCVTLTSAGLTSAGLKDLSVLRKGGTVPAGATGVFVNRGNNVIIQNVLSRNHARLYSFIASGTSGISCHMANCFGDLATENYFYIDTWPELYVTGGRFGSNNDYDNANAFIYVTGTQTGGTGIGPNTLTFTSCHFNGKGGGTGPAYFMQFDNVTVPAGNQVEYKIIGCHVESIRNANFKTTSTAPYFYRVNVTDTVFNTTSCEMFEFDSNTVVQQVDFTACKMYVAGFNLSGMKLITSTRFTGGEVIGPATSNITGPAGAGISNRIFLLGVDFAAGLNIDGTWTYLYARCRCGSLNSTNIIPFTSGSEISINTNVSNYYARQNGYAKRFRSGDNAAGVTINNETCRGTFGAPAVSSSNDAAFRFQALGYDGAAFERMGVYRIQVSGTPSVGSMPGKHVWSVTPPLSTSPADTLTLQPNGDFEPNVDNAFNLGDNGVRWAAVWAANGTIQTSDEREKKDVQPTELGLDFINALNPVSYKWKVGGQKVIRQVYRDADGNEVEPSADDAIPSEIITEKIEGHRTHHGLLAQEVKAALPEGVDFGGWVLTDKDNPDSQQALRYDQFISPLIKAVQQLSAKVEELESRS